MLAKYGSSLPRFGKTAVVSRVCGYIGVQRFALRLARSQLVSGGCVSTFWHKSQLQRACVRSALSRFLVVSAAIR